MTEEEIIKGRHLRMQWKELEVELKQHQEGSMEWLRITAEIENIINQTRALIGMPPDWFEERLRQETMN